MTDFLELAARVEAATGPLAEETALAVIKDAWKLLNPMPSPWRVPRQANGEPWGGDGLGPYTPEAKAWDAKHKSFGRLINAGASLDAAMTLVPEGCEWRARWTELPDRTWAGIGGVQHINTVAATPALALCAAALRSHAAKEGE